MVFFIDKKHIDLITKLIKKGNVVSSYKEAIELIEEKAQGKTIVSFVNMYAIQLALKNDKFADAILNSDFVFFDGIALRLLCSLFKLPYGLNMNGTDFIPEIIKFYEEKSLAVYASNQEALDLFIKKHKHLNLVSAINGFHEGDIYTSDALKTQPDLIILGMGMPKQELIAEKIEVASIVVNGGAIIDYLSDYKIRASKILIRLKLEWLYRIFYEPKRLFYRYFEGGILLVKIFFTLILRGR